MTFTLFEAETLPGIEPFTADELRRIPEIDVLEGRAGCVPFTFDGELNLLGTLRTATAIYRLLRFDVPRPKALLGHQIFKTIEAEIRGITGRKYDFQTLSLDAAGADSSVMVRVKNELATAVGLGPVEDKGDLHLRIRKAKNAEAWEVLIRLTPRPLITRSWRLHNVPGALSAGVAAAMAAITKPSAQDAILNLCCGTATLMVERASLGTSGHLYGIDNDKNVLDIARQHLYAGNVKNAALVCGDVTAMPFARQTFDVLLADLPFGQLVGSHQENMRLYPDLLHEAARVARKAARFALITHEKRLIADVIKRQSAWTITRQIPVNLNGLHPEIILLRRS